MKTGGKRPQIKTAKYKKAKQLKTLGYQVGDKLYCLKCYKKIKPAPPTAKPLTTVIRWREVIYCCTCEKAI